MQLKAFIKNKSKKLGIAPQLVLQNYMLERLLERMSKSEYADNFIIKGGFFLSAVVGLSTRATMDLDTTIKGFTLTHDKLKDIMTDICHIEIDDDVTFKPIRVTDIRETDDYPGLRVFLDANYPPIRVPITIDVTTGDIITPKETRFGFHTMFDDKTIHMLTYTIETVLAEKIETILARGIANTRPRDYYDVYTLYKFKSNEINYSILKEALEATCKKRNSEYIINDYEKIIKTLIESTELQKLWKKYQKSYSYAKEIFYEDTCKALGDILKLIYHDI